MTMYALVEQTLEGTYTASLIGWPAVTAQGGSEDEAVRALHHSLATRFQQARVVPVEIEFGSTTNPWIEMSDLFKANRYLMNLLRPLLNIALNPAQ